MCVFRKTRDAKDNISTTKVKIAYLPRSSSRLLSSSKSSSSGSILLSRHALHRLDVINSVLRCPFNSAAPADTACKSLVDRAISVGARAKLLCLCSRVRGVGATLDCFLEDCMITLMAKKSITFETTPLMAADVVLTKIIADITFLGFLIIRIGYYWL